MGGDTRSDWRKRFHKDEVIQRVRPKEFKGHLVNPHKGTATMQRFNGDEVHFGRDHKWNDSDAPTQFGPFEGSLETKQYPPSTIAYMRWVWKVFEPQEGAYRYDILEGALKAAAERGQTLQIRIAPHHGERRVPQWFLDSGGKEIDDRGCIDHNSPRFVERWVALTEAFGARFDGHPALESVDIAYGGLCGETGGNTSEENAKILVEAYLKAFKRTELVTMLGPKGTKIALEGGAGWRLDCIGDIHTGPWPGSNVECPVPPELTFNHMMDVYPKAVFRNKAQDVWRTRPITLETCWTVGYWEDKGWDIDWILEHSLKYHPSVFMPKSCYISDRVWDKIMTFNDKLGYKFVLRQLTIPLEAKPGQDMTFLTWIDNVGVAPIYRPYRLAYRFSQGERSEIVFSDADIRTWMPEYTWFEDSIRMPEQLSQGPLELSVALTDDKGVPKVAFANEGISKDGWLPLTGLDVL